VRWRLKPGIGPVRAVQRYAAHAPDGTRLLQIGKAAGGVSESYTASPLCLGYCLSEGERRELWLGLRFSTALCLALVVTGLALGSPALVFLLSGVGAIAGFTSRHPFDHLWNHGVRSTTPPSTSSSQTASSTSCPTKAPCSTRSTAFCGPAARLQIARISGGSGNDRLKGGSGNDRISGGPGRDRISGGPGNDRLKGGSGNDRISGGPGRDRISGGPGKNQIKQ
jgi:hypothetical protein